VSIVADSQEAFEQGDDAVDGAAVAAAEDVEHGSARLEGKAILAGPWRGAADDDVALARRLGGDDGEAGAGDALHEGLQQAGGLVVDGVGGGADDASFSFSVFHEGDLCACGMGSHPGEGHREEECFDFHVLHDGFIK